MEIRRVQLTGGSSYVLTLPKEWIRASNIKKNDPMGVYVQSDGTLLITPKMTTDYIRKTKTIEIKEPLNSAQLFRQLIASYIAGYTQIQISSKQRLSSTVRTTCRNFTYITIGQEVVEETDNSVILKDLLNPAEMPFDRTIKRMYILVKNMHEDTLKAAISDDTEMLKEIIQRDSEVDRLHWLIARQHNSILQNISLAEKLNTTIDNTFTYFLISRIIERISDHVVKIADNLTKLLPYAKHKDLIDSIMQASSKASDICNKSINSFFRKNINEANNTIETVKNLLKQCEEIDKLALQYESQIAIAIGIIIDSIRRIGEYAADISENVINYLITEK